MCSFICIILPSWKIMSFSILVRTRRQWVGGRQNHWVLVESGSSGNERRQRGAGRRFTLSFCRSAANKHDLLCGFADHGAATAAKGSPLLPPRTLAGGVGKAGVGLDTSARSVWRDISLRRWAKVFHEKLFCIYLAPERRPRNFIYIYVKFNIYMAFSRQNNTIWLVNLKVCFDHNYFSSDGLIERMPFTVLFPNVDS